MAVPPTLTRAVLIRRDPSCCRLTTQFYLAGSHERRRFECRSKEYTPVAGRSAGPRADGPVGAARAGAAVPYAFFDHTGDVGIGLSGRCLEELFSAAAEALVAVLTDPGTVVARQVEQIEIRAPALDLLLRDFLTELLYRFETQAFLPATVVPVLSHDNGEWRLTARVEGERFEPARHSLTILVKAVTYHRLEVLRIRDGWTATVVLDV